MNGQVSLQKRIYLWRFFKDNLIVTIYCFKNFASKNCIFEKKSHQSTFKFLNCFWLQILESLAYSHEALLNGTGPFWDHWQAILFQVEVISANKVSFFNGSLNIVRPFLHMTKTDVSWVFTRILSRVLCFSSSKFSGIFWHSQYRISSLQLCAMTCFLFMLSVVLKRFNSFPHLKEPTFIASEWKPFSYISGTFWKYFSRGRQKVIYKKKNISLLTILWSHHH